MHAKMLRSGDFRYQLPESLRAGEPYHVARLIGIGQPASDALVALLADTSPTPFRYVGRLSFGGETQKIVRGASLPSEHNALVCDLADYALRHIYAKDVGFRGYLPDADRSRKIDEWKTIVRACTGGKN